MKIPVAGGPDIRVTRRPTGGINIRRGATRIALADADAIALANAVVDLVEAPDADT